MSNGLLVRCVPRLSAPLWLAMPLLAMSGCGSADTPTPEAALLFGDRAVALSAEARQQVVALLELHASPDGTMLVDPYCGQPVHVETIDVRDLDGDGSPEVIFLGGNACMSGNAGQSLLLFTRQEGAFRAHLGFPAAGYELVPGPGMPGVRVLSWRPCVGVWSWDGETYRHARNEPLEPGGCEL